MLMAIVFDFDGVIVQDSEFFKQEAWRLVLAPYGQKEMDCFRQAEEKYGGGRGGDRFDILQEIYECLGEPADTIPSLVNEAAALFNVYLQKRILEVGVERNTRGALEELSKSYALYINSATPERELEQTVMHLKLDGLFKRVLGRPSNKVHNLRIIGKAEDVEPQNILFVGDGDRDYDAAREFGCHFLGYANDWNKWAGSDKQFPVVTNLRDVVTRVETILRCFRSRE